MPHLGHFFLLSEQKTKWLIVPNEQDRQYLITSLIHTGQKFSLAVFTQIFSVEETNSYILCTIIDILLNKTQLATGIKYEHNFQYNITSLTFVNDGQILCPYHVLRCTEANPNIYFTIEDILVNNN